MAWAAWNRINSVIIHTRICLSLIVHLLTSEAVWDIRSVASEGNSHPFTPINERRNVSKKCQKIADFLRAFRTDLHIILYTSLQSTSHQYSSVQPHCVSQCPASFKFVPHPTAEEQQCVPFRMTRRNGRIIVLVKMLTHSRALCVSEWMWGNLNA